MAVVARNVVHAASTSSSAALGGGCLLGAEFVAWVQILIYVGAIVILFLFGLMLTKAPIGRDTLDNQQRGIGALVGVGVFAGLVFLIQEAFPVQDAVAFETRRAAPTWSVRRSSATACCRSRRSRSCCSAALIGAIVLAARTTPRDRAATGADVLGPAVLRGSCRVLARRSAVMVLMAIELMLNAVSVNLVALRVVAAADDRPGLRAVRDRRGRRRGGYRARDRDPAVPHA